MLQLSFLRNFRAIFAQMISFFEVLIWQQQARLEIQKEAWSNCQPKVDFMPATAPTPIVLRSKKITWVPPKPPWIKLNADGAYMAATGKAGGGGLIRDTRGRLLRAFCLPLRAVSCLEAELMALGQGIVLAKTLGSNIWIEVDVTMVVDMIGNGKLGPVNIRHTLTYVRGLLRNTTYRISHIQWEGNRPADYMAQRGANEGTHATFDSTTAPPYLTAIVQMEQLGLPNFRFRGGIAS